MTTDQSTGFDSKTFLRSLSHRPGVYCMLNAKGKVIYVGKARDLRKRVSSYFQRAHADAKTATLMQHVANVNVTITNTEAEALLLEYNMIKRHKPRFNVVLRDDKSYPYIHVAVDHEFPRIEFHRGARTGKGRYFGPYPNASAVRRTVNELQKLFLIRSCQDSYFSNRNRPCLQYQIRRCTAPCVGYIDSATYREDVNAAILFLEGRNRSVIEAMVSRMERAASQQDYEQAARYRDQIKRIKSVEAEQLVSRNYGKDIDVIASASQHGVWCVTVLFIRNGAVLGSRNHFPKIAGDPEKEEVLSGFLSQYYLGREAPGEIIVDAVIEDEELLEQGMSQQSNRKVEIRHRVRGDRLSWVQMARTNAEQGVSLQVASNATMRNQLQSLAEALDLDAVPERIECFDVSHSSGEATVMLVG